MSFTLLGILQSQAAGVSAEPAFDLLSTNNSGGGFSGLDSLTEYDHLQIRSMHRGTRDAANAVDVLLKINGDPDRNYTWHKIVGYGGNPGTGDNTSDLKIRIGGGVPGTYAPAGDRGFTIIDILDFHSTNITKTIRAYSGYARDGQVNLQYTQGSYDRTSRITSVSLDASLNDFNSGSSISKLYGYKKGVE